MDKRNVCLGSKADMAPFHFDVRFTSESGHTKTPLQNELNNQRAIKLNRSPLLAGGNSDLK
jgi:hypothetical protein